MEWVLSLGDESITVYDSIYTFEGLDAETTYQVSVVAACGGETSEARTKSFTTTIACPAPTSLAATLTPGNGSVATLAWTEGGIATAWQICLDDNENNVIDVTTNPYTLTGLTPEQTYTAKVRAVCGGEDGSSQWSSAITFTPTNAYSITVNDGTATNTYVPVYGTWVDNYIRSQFVILAEELANMQSGTINKLTFYSSNASVNWGSASFKVYLTETDATGVSALASWDDMEQVYEGSLSISGNKMEVTLDNPYLYMGGNLLVGFYQTVSGSYVSCNWYGVSSTGASFGGYGTGVSQQNFLPKTTFSYTPGDGTPCLRVSNLAVDSVGTDYALPSWTPGQENDNLWLVMLNNEEIATTTSNTYYIANLEPNTNYTVSVATLCEDGDTSDWRTVQFITEAACSALVYSLEAGSVGGDYATISWWVDSTVEVYSVYLNGELMGTSTTGAFTFTGLEGLTTYTASVMAMCGTETGVASTVEFTTEMYCSAGSCEVTIVGSDSFGDGWNGNAINVLMNGNLVGTFSPTSGGKDAPIVESYTVCKGAPVSFSWISGSYSSETSFTIKDGADMEVYSGSDAQSSTFFTLENACPSCMPVSDVAVFDITANSAVLSWSTEDSNGMVMVVINGDTIVAEGTMYSFDNLAEQTVYNVSISAICDGEVSAWRNVEFTTMANCSPALDLAVNDITSYSAVLDWYSNADIYEIYILDDTNTTFVTSVGDLGYTLYGLASNTNYTIGVQAVCGDNVAEMSIISFRTLFAVDCNNGNAVMVSNADSSTATTANVPGTSNYNYSYSEVIIPAEQLEGIGMVQALQFKPNVATSGDKYTNCTIYLANTTAENLASSFLQDTSTFELVWSGDMSYYDNEWQTVAFDTPFEYDGESNVVVAVLRNHGSYTSGAKFDAYNAEASIARYVQRDNSPYTLGSITGGTSASVVPLYRLLGCEASACRRVKDLAVYDIAAYEAIINWTPATADDLAWAVKIGDEEYTTNENEFWLQGLAANTDYTVSVATLCSDGDTSAWRSVQFTTLPSCLPAQNINATVTAYDATLTWYGLGQYHWEVQLDNSEWISVYDTTYTLEELSPATTYTVRLHAVCDDGDTSTDVAMQFTTYLSCEPPTYLTASDVAATYFTVNWDVVYDMALWQLVLTSTSAAEGDSISISSDTVYSDFPYYTFTDLEPLTNYMVTVSTICDDEESESATVSVTTTMQEASIPYMTGFDEYDDVDWLTANSTNGWYIGEATNNGGSRALYISNDNGNSNAYSVSTASASYFYKTFALEEREYIVSYDWMSGGEGNWDYMRVFAVPANVELIAGNNSGINTSNTPDGWIALDGGGKLNLNGDWTNVEVTFTPEMSGNYNIVFYWRNDNSGGTQPGAAVDNFSINSINCYSVTDFYAIERGATSVDLGWYDENGVDVTYNLYYAIYGSNDTVLAASGLTGDSYTVDGLQSNTAYNFWLVTVCSDGELSLFKNYSCMTDCAEPTCDITVTANSDYSYSSSYYSPKVNLYQNDMFMVGVQGTTQTISVCPTEPIVVVYNAPSSSYYTPMVSIVNASGVELFNGETSNYSTGDTLLVIDNPCSNCAPAQNVRVYDITTTSVTVAWDGDSNGTYYLANYWNPEYNNTVTGNTFVLTDLNPQVHYNYTITRICADDEMSAAVPFEFSTEHPCKQISSVWIDSISAHSIALSWMDSINEGATYSVLCKFNGDTVAYESTTEMGMTITGLDQNTDYNFEVYAWCPGGYGSVYWIDARTLCDTVYYDTVVEWACGRYYYNGLEYAQSGVYYDNIYDDNGCMYATTLMLDIYPEYSDTVAVSAVNYYVWYGDTLKNSAVYPHIGTSVYGCDSIEFLDLTITIEVACDSMHSSVTVSNTNASDATIGFIPGYSYYNFSYSEVIIPAEMLEGIGTVKALQFKPAAITAGDMFTNCEVYLANTTVADLSNSFIQDTNSFELVWSGDMSYSSTDWQTLLFDTPFVWDGSSNIVVAVRRNDGAWASGSSFAAYTADAQLGRYAYQDNGAYEIGSITAAGTATNKPAWYKLVGCNDGATIACARVRDLQIEEVAAHSVTLSWTDTDNVNATYSIYSISGSDTVLLVNGIDVNVYTIGGLDANKVYMLGVVANCQEGETSSMARMSFRTECEAISSLPYTCGFEENEIVGTSAAEAMPYCWTRLNDNGNYPYSNSTSAHTGSRVLYFYGANYSGAADYIIAVLPPVDIETLPLSTMRLRFWGRTSGSSVGTVKVGTMSDPNDESTFTLVQEVQISGTEFDLKTVGYFPDNGDQYIAIRMDKGDSYQYAYIDDLSLEVLPDCADITGLTVTNVDEYSVTLQWDGVADSYMLYLSDGSVVETYDTMYTIDNLYPATPYTFGVAANCGNDLGLVSYVTAQTYAIPAYLPYTTGFEYWDDNDWLFVNGTNAWTIGSAAINDGERALYVSNNGGDSNSYTNNVASISYAYRTIRVEQAGNYVVDFDWKGNGEGNYDFMRAWIAPASFQFKANNYPDNASGYQNGYTPAGWCSLAAAMNNVSTWQHLNQIVTIDEPGIYNLVFMWRNDGTAGTNPPAAVDNVSIEHMYCQTPDSLTATVTANTATITWSATGIESSWEVYFNRDNIVYDSIFEPMVTFTDLQPNTTYTVGVAANCNGGEGSDWSYLEFTTAEPSLECEGNTCQITIAGQDGYGDGWNGNTINILQNNSIVGTFTLDNGSAATNQIPVCVETPISLQWIAGSWPDETSFQVLNANNETVLNVGNGGVLPSGKIFLQMDDCYGLAAYNVINDTTVATVCDNYYWYRTGLNYTESGVYEYDYVDTSAYSLNYHYVLDLTVNNSVTVTNDTLVLGKYVFDDGGYVNYSGTIMLSQETMPNGCDSTVNLHVTVFPIDHTDSMIYINGCDMVVISHMENGTLQNHYWYDSGILDSVIYYDEEDNRCMATATVNIGHNFYFDTTIVAIDSFEWQGEVYTQNTWLEQKYETVSGCDSMVYITIQIVNGDTLHITACDYYNANGNWYYGSGVYLYDTTEYYENVYDSVTCYEVWDSTGSSYLKCDTMQIFEDSYEISYSKVLDLTINYSIYRDTMITAYGSYVWDGDTLTEDGWYNHVYTAANGCDSMVYVNLDIINPEDTVTHYITVINHGRGYVDDQMNNGYGFFPQDTNVISGNASNQISLRVISMPGSYAAQYGFGSDSTMLVGLAIDGEEIAIDGSDERLIVSAYTNEIYYAWYENFAFDADHTIELWFEPWVSPCVAPENLYADNITNESFTISWDAPYDTNEEVVYYMELTSVYNTVFDTIVNANYYEFHNLTPTTDYLVNLTRICSDGSEISSQMQVITYGAPHTITFINEGDGLAVFEGYTVNDTVFTGYDGEWLDLYLYDITTEAIAAYGFEGLDSMNTLLQHIYIDGQEIAINTSSNIDNQYRYEAFNYGNGLFVNYLSVSYSNDHIIQVVYGPDTTTYAPVQDHMVTVNVEGDGYIYDYELGERLYGYNELPVNADNQRRFQIITFSPAIASSNDVDGEWCRVRAIWIDGQYVDLSEPSSTSTYSMEISDYMGSYGYRLYDLTLTSNKDYQVDVVFGPYYDSTECMSMAAMNIVDPFDTTAIVQWIAGSGTNTYILTYGLTENFNQDSTDFVGDHETVTITSTDTIISYLLTGLQPNTQYTARVAMYCDNGGWWYWYRHFTTSGDPHTITFINNGGPIQGELWGKDTIIESHYYEGWRWSTFVYSLSAPMADGNGIDDSVRRLQQIIIDGQSIDYTVSDTTDDYQIYTYTDEEPYYTAYRLVVNYNADHTVQFVYGPGDDTWETHTITVTNNGGSAWMEELDRLDTTVVFTGYEGQSFFTYLYDHSPEEDSAWYGRTDRCKLHYIVIDGNIVNVNESSSTEDYYLTVNVEPGYTYYTLYVVYNADHTVEFVFGPQTADTIVEPGDTTHVAVCGSYIWHNFEFTESGTYHVGNEVLVLTVNASSYSSERVVVCDSYQWNGSVYTESGVYTSVVGTNASGCDSIATLLLVVNNSGVDTLSVQACDSYLWYGDNLTVSGTYTHDTVTSDGCNITEVLLLTINNSTEATHYQMACDEFSWNDTVYTQSGVYYAYEENEAGCVHTEVLYLTVNYTSADDTTMTVCDSYTWNGETYTESGEYTYVSANAQGCDNTSTLYLTVNHSTADSLAVTVCDEYTWKGITYTQSGIYTYDTLNAIGCDSTVILNLTVNYNTVDTLDISACDSYEWRGETYTESGEYTYETEAETGCTSTEVLLLTVNYSLIDTLHVEACDSYRWNNFTFTTDGTYTFQGTTDAGCSSVSVLDLTVNHSTADTATITACDSYLWNDSVYTQSGVYTFVGTNDQGCSHTSTLYLTVNYSTADTINMNVCDAYEWYGEVYAQSGTYIHTETNNGGCIATEVLNLAVSYSTADSIFIDACDSYEWNGETYTESGVYTFQSTNDQGCTHTSTLYLTVNNTVRDTIVATACDTYTWNGNVYTQSGVYTHTSAAENGCDHVSLLNLTVNYSSIDTISVVACDEYTWQGITYTATGVYSVDTVNVSGCDSTVVLDLVVNYSTTAVETIEACNNYVWHGVDYVTSTIEPTFTTTNAAGCDSTITLHLTINHCSTTEIVACDSYTWRGSVYTTSGTYVDGTDTLLLTVNYSTTASEFIVACDQYTWHGVTYTASTNEPTFTMSNTAGCDSTISLNLIVNRSTADSVAYTVCDQYTWNGNVYTQSGVYTYNTVNLNGCDSTAVLDLTVNYSTSSVSEETACDAYTWNNIIFTSNGTFTYNTYNAAGCDSTSTVNLTIHHSTAGDTLASVCGSFDWYEYTGIDTTASLTHVFAGANTVGCDSTVTLHLTVNQCSVTEVVACNSYQWHGYTYTNDGVYADGFDTLILTINRATTGDTFAAVCGGLDWYEYSIDTTGSVSHTFLGANAVGCDSVVTLHLTVNHCSTTNVVACDSYEWNGFVFTSNGTFVDGFDTLHLTIKQSVMGDTMATTYDSFDWYEHTGLDVSQNVTHTFTAANGCDSTVTLHLTVKQHSVYEIVACDSYEWNGEVFTSSGTFVMGDDTLVLTVNRSSHGDTLARSTGNFDWYEYTGLNTTQSVNHTFDSANYFGCDSIVTLHLLVTQANVPAGKGGSVDTVEACDQYTWHGFTLTSTGVYPLGSDTLLLTIHRSNTGDTIAEECNTFDWYEHLDLTSTCNVYHTIPAGNIHGCDSTVTLHLTISSCTNESEVTCGTYTWHGYNLTSSGVYYDGRDTLNLTVNRPTTADTVAVACGSFDWYEYTDLDAPTQSVAHTFLGANGCDSTVTLHLAVNQCSTIEATACDSYQWNGFLLTSSGTYISGNDTLMLTVNRSISGDTFAVACNEYDWYEHTGLTATQSISHTFYGGSYVGCDSTVTLHLTVNHCSTEVVAACDSYEWHGFNFTSSGTYLAGHDTLMLTINRSSATSESVTACNNYVWHGVDYSAATDDATYTYTDINGCDSVVTLHLTINQCSTTEITACDQYTWHGGVYNTSGVYTDGSDTLLLTINRSSMNIINATACDSYTWHGTTYTSSTTATYTTENAVSCDSVTTLVLTVNHPVPTVTSQTVCDIYNWHTNNYTTSGDYTFAHTDANGCNQVDTLHLTVNHSVVTTEQIAACDQYELNGTVYTESAVVNYTGTTAAGCDSMATINLTINHSVAASEQLAVCDQYELNGTVYTESATVTYNGTTAAGCDSVVTIALTINHSVATYDTMVVSESDLPTVYDGHSIAAAGDYTFDYTTSTGCDSTVYLHVVANPVGIDDVDLEVISLYPNPTTGRVTISSDNVVKVEVMDITGRKVATFHGTNTFDIGHLAEGSYTLRITLDQGTTIRKVIKR